MALTIIKTNSANESFKKLVAELDEHLAILNGDKNSFYVAHNKIEALNNVIVVFNADEPVGIGAIKKISETRIEIKRMYVKPNCRGQGIASSILKELENWAYTLGYSKSILETLKIKESVIEMYKKMATLLHLILGNTLI